MSLKKPPLPPPPPVPPRNAEIDDADLLADGWDAPPSSKAGPPSSTHKLQLPPLPPPPPINPFLPADSQPHQPVAEVAATAAVENDLTPPQDPLPGEEAKAPEVSAPTPTPTPTPRKRSRAWVFLLVAVLATVGGVFAYQAKLKRDAEARRSASFEIPRNEEPAAPVIVSSEPAPPPTYSSAQPAKSAAPSAKPGAGSGHAPAAAVSIPAGQSGIIDTSPLPPGRKIVVNGRVVGSSPQRVTVRCGTLRVQIGDLAPESISMPCGGEVTFTD